jgi:hypothetical protein
MKDSDAKIRGRREKAMKVTTVVKASMFAAALGFACLLPATVHAQAEVAPDHLRTYQHRCNSRAERMPCERERSQNRFYGQFSLPYSVKCRGRRTA